MPIIGIIPISCFFSQRFHMDMPLAENLLQCPAPQPFAELDKHAWAQVDSSQGKILGIEGQTTSCPHTHFQNPPQVPKPLHVGIGLAIGQTLLSGTSCCLCSLVYPTFRTLPHENEGVFMVGVKLVEFSSVWCRCSMYDPPTL